MWALIAGLVVFLGLHSVRIFAEDWRQARRAAWGEGAWKGLYSVGSAVGLALIIWGYGLSRIAPVDLWMPPVWTRHLSALLTVPAFVLLVAAYVPGNRIRSAVGHPMILAVKLWAFAHLLANGRLADVLLFGSFLVWAVLDFRSARRRPPEAGVIPAAAPALWRDLVVVFGGLGAWAVFAIWLHASWIGVRPFGG